MAKNSWTAFSFSLLLIALPFPAFSKPTGADWLLLNMTPSQIAHLALGDLSDLRHHLERANHFRNQAFERLQELVDEGHTDEVETVRQSAIYQELMNEAETDLKHASGC